MKISSRFYERICWLAFGLALAFGQTLLAQVPVDPSIDSASFLESEDPSRWSYSALIAVPLVDPTNANQIRESNSEGILADVILGPEILSKAKPDLSDLRIFDAMGHSIPFGLRYLHAKNIQQVVPSNEFNRDEPDDGVHQLTLDLFQNEIEHNSMRVVTTGENFRRSIEIDGSDDGSKWRRLTTGNLVRFSEGEQKFKIDTMSYSDSRFRYMRVRVVPDPDASTADNDRDLFSFSEVSVLREVTLPGERMSMEAKVGSRQGIRSAGAPGSSWIVDLGGDNIPCDQIEVDVADRQFVREVSLQAELPYGPLGQNVFSTIFGSYSSTWQRKPGDAQRPMTASFDEVQTSRLRLLVTDYRNAPLTIRSVKFSASVRQMVFAHPALTNSELRLFVGNPDADLPYYDFARNLPDQLSPAPVRGQVLVLAANPNFVPLPKAFLERFPWLIYVVLATVIGALAVVIASLARTAINLHDTELINVAPKINSTT